jgi:hypothetical protein
LVQNEDTVGDAATQYAQARSKLLELDRWLANNTETAVGAAIRKLYVDHAIDELMQKERFSDMAKQAIAKNADQAKRLYAGNPRISDILNNTVALEEFDAYLATRPNGKALSDFYDLLYKRETVKIADAAQGDALVKLGFKQNTIVLLSRDAANPDALKTALAEAEALMDDVHLEGFLNSRPLG